MLLLIYLEQCICGRISISIVVLQSALELGEKEEIGEDAIIGSHLIYSRSDGSISCKC